MYTHINIESGLNTWEMHSLLEKTKGYAPVMMYDFSNKQNSDFWKMINGVGVA